MSYIQKALGQLKKDEKGNDIPGSNVYSFKFTQPAIAEIGVLNEGNIDPETMLIKNWVTFLYAVLWGGLYGWYKVKRLEMDFDFEKMCEWADEWSKDANNAEPFKEIVECYIAETGTLPKDDKKKEIPMVNKSAPKSTKRSATKSP